GRWQDTPIAKRMVTGGEELDSVMVILSGKTRVESKGKAITELGAGKFIGEMSFLTGDKPNADVIAVEGTRLLVWPKPKLRKFLGDNPDLRSALQLIIGTDLVTKLKAA